MSILDYEFRSSERNVAASRGVLLIGDTPESDRDLSATANMLSRIGVQEAQVVLFGQKIGVQELTMRQRLKEQEKTITTLNERLNTQGLELNSAKNTIGCQEYKIRDLNNEIEDASLLRKEIKKLEREKGQLQDKVGSLRNALSSVAQSISGVVTEIYQSHFGNRGKAITEAIQKLSDINKEATEDAKLR